LQTCTTISRKAEKQELKIYSQDQARNNNNEDYLKYVLDGRKSFPKQLSNNLAVLAVAPVSRKAGTKIYSQDRARNNNTEG
jgi:hypothetical protein